MDVASPLESLSSLDLSLPTPTPPSAAERRLQYLRGTLKNIKSASTNSKVKNIEESLQNYQIRVFRGNPEKYAEALPTALICEPAGKIIDLFSRKNDQPLSSELLATASNLTREMRKFYRSEDERFDAFIQQLTTVISFTKSGPKGTGAYDFRAKYGPDGFREKPRAEKPAAISLLIEAKWEIGTSGDPTMQICLDYAATAGKMSFRKIGGHFPCLLVTVSGVMMTAQLGVVGECAQVEFLGCHSFQSADLQSGAQFIMSLKEAIRIIEDYYDSDAMEVQHVDVPYWCNLSIDGFVVTIEYLRALKKGATFVYEAAINSGKYRRLLPLRLVIKFVQGKYGEDVHRCLLEQLSHQTQRVCPRLFGVHNLPGGWKAVVMEHIEAITDGNELASLDMQDKVHILEALTTATRIMHKFGFVHGDLREPNILLHRDGGRVRAFIVDFDLADKESEAIYPVDLNFAAFPWLEVEVAGGKIEKTHDLDALDFYASDFLCL